MDTMKFAESVMNWAIIGGLIGGLIAIIYVILKKKGSDKNKEFQ
jgi:membrane associated rhomboid family serine protease